ERSLREGVRVRFVAAARPILRVPRHLRHVGHRLRAAAERRAGAMVALVVPRGQQPSSGAGNPMNSPAKATATRLRDLESVLAACHESQESFPQPPPDRVPPASALA